MKRIFAVVTCILLFSRYAHCDAVKEAVTEVIQSRLEKTVDDDFRKLGYWKDLLANTADNQPEITVSRILADYASNPGAKDAALNGLERLAPEAVGPVSLLISAREALQQSTNNMQELYKEKRLAEFLDAVVKSAATSQELKKNYDAFKSTAAFAGLTANERQEIESRMGDIFLQRLSAVSRNEKAAEAQKLIEQIVSRSLKKIRSDAFFKVNLAKDCLVAAAHPVTPDTIRRFMNDAAFASSVETKAKEEIVKRKTVPAVPAEVAVRASTVTAKPAEAKAGASDAAAAGETAPQSETKTTAPAKGIETPADSLVSRTLQLEITAAMAGTKVDYAPFVSLCRDAAERLIAGSVSGEAFNDMSRRVLLAANIAFNTALANAPLAEKPACREAYARFTDETNLIRKGVDEKAAALKGKLEELASSKEWTPTEYYAQLTANFNNVYSRIKDATDPVVDMVRNEASPSFAFEVKRRGGGKQASSPLSLPELRARYQQYAVAVASCGAVIAETERCANLLREKIKSYDPEFKKHYADYGALYSANVALADYAGIKFYNFQKEIDGISGAQEMLSYDAGTFVSGGYINGLKRNYALLAKEAESWKAQADGNGAFVAAYGALPDKVKPLGAVKGVEKVTPEYFQSYYDKNLRDFIVANLQGALALLSEATRGTDPQEQVRYGTGEMRVGELAATKAFTTLAEHEKRLKEFREKIAAIREMDMDSKGGRLAEMTGNMQKEYDAIVLKSTETQKLWNDLEQARTLATAIGGAARAPELPRLFNGTEWTLSAKVLQSLADQYAAGIGRAADTEKKMVETFKKYQANPLKPAETKLPQDYRDAMAAIGARKWDFAQNVWAEYGKLAKVNADMAAAENRKFNPVKSLAVGEKQVDPVEPQDVAFTPADLRDGVVSVEGKLYPEAVKQVARLWITLDGGKTKESLPVGESFSYKFKPKEETAYAIKVIPELVSKEKAGTFPAGETVFSCTYSGKMNKSDAPKK